MKKPEDRTSADRTRMRKAHKKKNKRNGRKSRKFLEAKALTERTV